MQNARNRIPAYGRLGNLVVLEREWTEHGNSQVQQVHICRLQQMNEHYHDARVQESFSVRLEQERLVLPQDTERVNDEPLIAALQQLDEDSGADDDKVTVLRLLRSQGRHELYHAANSQ